MKKSSILSGILFGLFLLAGTLLTSAQTQRGLQWSSVDTPKESLWVLYDDPNNTSEKIDVIVKDGYVYISSNKSAQAKVVTILGQPVATKTIQAGTTRLSLPIRGIYILKVGETTRRINI